MSPTLSEEDLDAMGEIAGEIADLIQPLSPDRAEFARDFAQKIRQTPAEIWTLYTSHAWWGGPGSMADFVLLDDRQNRAYMALIARLARRFQSAGYDYGRARSWADAFESWAASHPAIHQP
jgi:hypothetical protein